MDIDKLKTKLDNEQGDYYENIVLYIKALIENGQSDEAFSLLKTEINQPYVPQKTLDALEKIFEEYYVAEVVTKQLSVEEAKEALKSLQIENIVPNFFTLNLRLLTEEIAYYLERTDDYVSASVLIYTLIDQQVDLEFKFTKFGRSDYFNSLNLKIVDEELLVKYNELFELKFAKEPSLVKYCTELLNYYLLVVFPFKMDTDFEIFDEIVNYVLKLSKDNTIKVNPDFLEIIEYDLKEEKNG